MAELVFIGGSLIRRGGQNPLEAAVFSKPILFGPNMGNFTSIVNSFLKHQAAIVVEDAQQMQQACLKLLGQPTFSNELGQRARKLVDQNRGSSLRNTELISELLKINGGINEGA